MPFYLWRLTLDNNTCNVDSTSSTQSAATECIDSAPPNFPDDAEKHFRENEEKAGEAGKVQQKYRMIPLTAGTLQDVTPSDTGAHVKEDNVKTTSKQIYISDQRSVDVHAILKVQRADEGVIFLARIGQLTDRL
jgi:hypothetical protein